MDFISQIINEVVESVVEERWLPIVGYEGKYEVSDLGRVKSFARYKNGKILKLSSIDNGYLQIQLWSVLKKFHLVHRLVLQAFLPIDEELDCDHINHITNDNRLVNLRWATNSQNIRYQPKREGCSSRYKGVSWFKRDNNWKTQCKIDGKTIHIGCFDDEDEAGKAYNEFIIKNDLQDFTHLNEIN